MNGIRKKGHYTRNSSEQKKHMKHKVNYVNKDAVQQQRHLDKEVEGGKNSSHFPKANCKGRKY